VKKFGVLKKIKITEVYRGDYTGTGKKACAESSQARRNSQVTSTIQATANSSSRQPYYYLLLL